MDDGAYAAAMGTLEGLEMTPETNGMWAQLGEAALAAGELVIAERCAVALGDVARARFLHKVSAQPHAHAPSPIAAPLPPPPLAVQTSKMAMLAAGGAGGSDGRGFWKVRARLALLRKDPATAESIYLEQGKPGEAAEMYQASHTGGLAPPHTGATATRHDPRPHARCDT
jgi:intraflagellar transport protein 172